MTDVFPIKCYCGEIIGDKYEDFIQKVKFPEIDTSYKYMLFSTYKDHFIGSILDELGVTNTCCRKVFVTFMSRTDIETWVDH